LCPTSRATATNWARTCASSPTLSVTVVASRIKAPWVRISRNLWTQIVRFHRVPIQVSPRGPQFRFCAFKWGLHKFFQGGELGIYSTTHAVNMEMRSNIHFFFAIWAVLIRAECTSSKTFAESPAAYFYSYGILSGKLRAAIPLYFFNSKELYLRMLLPIRKGYSHKFIKFKLSSHRIIQLAFATVAFGCLQCLRTQTSPTQLVRA